MDDTQDGFEDPTELDYSPSSTATDPDGAAQDVSESLKTGRHRYTANATFIAGDIPAHSDRWQTLNQANRERCNGNDDDVVNTHQTQWEVDRQNDVKAWGTHIGLTVHEIQRAQVLVGASDRGMRERHGDAAIVLAALTLAANEGHDSSLTTPRTIRPHGPALAADTADEDAIEEMTEAYTSLRNDLDVEPETIRRCRNHLHDVLDPTSTDEM